MSRRSRRRELKRLGAELIRLEQQWQQFDSPEMDRIIGYKITMVKAALLQATQESLDHADGVPPRLVNDLLARPFTEEEMALIFEDQYTHEPEGNTKHALVDSTPNPLLPNYRPR